MKDYKKHVCGCFEEGCPGQQVVDEAYAIMLRRSRGGKPKLCKALGPPCYVAGNPSLIFDSVEDAKNHMESNILALPDNYSIFKIHIHIKEEIK